MANGYDFADAMPDVGYDATLDRVEADRKQTRGIIKEDEYTEADLEAIANLKQRLSEVDTLAQELGLGDWATGDDATIEAKKQDHGLYSQVPIEVDEKSLGERLADALNLGKTVISDASASTTSTAVSNQKAYDDSISLWDRVKDISMSDVYGYPIDAVTEILNMALPKDWEIERPIGGSQQLSEDATALVETVKELDQRLAGNVDLISKVIGYPVDAVTTILNVIPGIQIDTPVGGSEWYENLVTGVTTDDEGNEVISTDVVQTTVPGEEIFVEQSPTGQIENKYLQNFIAQQKDILETATALEKDWRSKYESAKKSTGSSMKAHLNKEVQKAAKLMNEYKRTDEYIKAYGIVNPNMLHKLGDKLPVAAFAKRAEEFLRARNMYTKITGDELLKFVKQGIKEGIPYHLKDKSDPSRNRDISAFKEMYPAASGLSDEEILYLMNNPEALRAWLETLEDAN